MARKKSKVQNQQTELQAEHSLMVENGLGEALLGTAYSGLGTSQLSQVDTLFKNNRWYLISNMRQILSEIYVEHGIIQTIVDVPVDDGLRGGPIFKSEQLDEQQIKQLQTVFEREDDLTAYSEAEKWKRLFGGGGVLIITNQRPDTPLDLKKIKPDSPLEFRAVDLWELYSEQSMDNYENSPTFKARPNDEFFNYYGKKVHKSRVIKMPGLKAPSFIRPRLRGWGFSVVESLVRSVNQYLKATDLSFEVLDEHKLDIFKIKGLTQALAAKDGSAKIHQRVQLANMQKNYQNALTMDAEDSYEQKELAFAGLSEVMTGIRMQIASDLRMPLTKVFGISAAGFSSGEDDIENYNGMIESTIRSKGKFNLVRMGEIRCQQLFGFVPDDLEVDFHPLRVLSTEQEENVKTLKFSRLIQARQAGEIDSKEFKESCNKENLLGITVDVSRDTLEMPGAGEGSEGGAAGSAGKSSIAAPEAAAAKNSLSEKSENDLPHIVVVGLVCGDRILTGKRRDNGKWTFPGGHLDGNELPLAGAVREVFEETGIRIETDALTQIDHERVTSHRTGKDFLVTCFLANCDPQTASNELDPDQEFERLDWVRLDPEAEELKRENRHAKKDNILAYLFKAKNSLGYEQAVYTTTHVAERTARWKKRLYDHPDVADAKLWKTAKENAVKLFGKEDWQFVLWYYEQHGGEHK